MLLPEITDQQLSRAEAEQFIQSTLDALSAHIAVLDANGDIIGVNRAWIEYARMNGYQGNEFGLGVNYIGVCAIPENGGTLDQVPADVAQGILDVIAGKIDEFEMEYPCHSPDEKRWFVVRVSRWWWRNEARIIVAHHNISELKLVQNELEDSRYRLQAILDNISNGIIVFDEQGIIETVNPAAARIFGYGVGEMTGMSLAELIIDDPDASFAENEITGCKRDGSQFPLYFSIQEFTLQERKIQSAIIRDLTMQKRMESERLENEKVKLELEKERELRDMKNEFLSRMSHELQTPLASIRLSNDILEKFDERIPPEEKEQYHKNVSEQVSYLSEIVSDMISLSRSDSESLDFTPEAVDFITYCRGIMEEFQLTYYKSHQLEFECDSSVIVAEIDRRIMRRAVTNLISNAIKYSPDGGIVSLVLKLDGQDVMLTVSDTGIGIPEDAQADLFEPFQRAQNVRNLPGSGLGLAIVKQALEVHGGNVQLESEVGKGSCFTIAFPQQRSVV